ncbi:hypothetical protein ACOSQ2_002763 [Xanthoceras sorbifolium]
MTSELYKYSSCLIYLCLSCFLKIVAGLREFWVIKKKKKKSLFHVDKSFRCQEASVSHDHWKLKRVDIFHFIFFPDKSQMVKLFLLFSCKKKLNNGSIAIDNIMNAYHQKF